MQGYSHIFLSLKHFPCNSGIINLHKSGRDIGMSSSSFFAQSSISFRVSSGGSGHCPVEFAVFPNTMIPWFLGVFFLQKRAASTGGIETSFLPTPKYVDCILGGVWILLCSCENGTRSPTGCAQRCHQNCIRNFPLVNHNFSLERQKRYWFGEEELEPFNREWIYLG